MAGAVFMDSGMDLTKVWGVYYRMMKPYIGKSPITALSMYKSSRILFWRSLDPRKSEFDDKMSRSLTNQLRIPKEVQSFQFKNSSPQNLVIARSNTCVFPQFC